MEIKRANLSNSYTQRHRKIHREHHLAKKESFEVFEVEFYYAVNVMTFT